MIEFIRPDYAPNGIVIYEVGDCLELHPKAEEYYVQNEFAEYIAPVNLNNAAIEGSDI